MEVIWRYLNDFKFKSLVDTSSLYFANAASDFEDPNSILEGYLTLNEQSGINRSLKNRSGFDEFLADQKRKTYLSCWCRTDIEDIRMWNEYVGIDINGLAIKTTKEKIKKSVSNEILDLKDCYFRDVEYIDPISTNMGNINVVKLYSRKINDYRYENEFRAIIQLYNQEQYPDHISIPVDLDHFIDEIIFSPYADDIYKNYIRSYLDNKIQIVPKSSNISRSVC